MFSKHFITSFFLVCKNCAFYVRTFQKPLIFHLNIRRFKVFRDVDVAEGVVEAEVVDGKPLELGDLLGVGQGDGDLVVEVAVQHVRTILLIRNYESLRTGPTKSKTF